jgi:hypothetical protein
VWEPLIEAVRPKGKTPPKELRQTIAAIFWQHGNGCHFPKSAAADCHSGLQPPRSALCATGRPAVCAALQPTLTKCDALQPILAQIEANCGTPNRYESRAGTEIDFGK